MAAACYGLGFRRVLAGVSLFVIPLAVYAAQRDRIQEPAEENSRVVLNGNVNAHAIAVNDRGAVEASRFISHVKLVAAQTAEQAAALEQLLEEQRDPASANYHNWLTPEEYGERFGLSEGDIGTLTSWLQSQGFAVEQVARARNWIAFSGSAGQIAAPFTRRYTGTRWMARCTSRTRRRRRFPRPSRASWASCAASTTSVRSRRGRQLKHIRLSTPPMDRIIWRRTIWPRSTTSRRSYHAGFNGAGQTLVIAGQTDINISDIRGFRTEFNLAANDPQLVLYGTGSGCQSRRPDRGGPRSRVVGSGGAQREDRVCLFAKRFRVGAVCDRSEHRAGNQRELWGLRGGKPRVVPDDGAAGQRAGHHMDERFGRFGSGRLRLGSAGGDAWSIGHFSGRYPRSHGRRRHRIQ